MRISKLLMPAVTLAGALALAGCGGGSGGTGTTPTCPTGQTGTPPNCVPATDAQKAATTAVNTAASQAGALGATSDATAVNAARASLTAAVNAVNALPAAQRGQFSARLTRASGQIRTQELRLARAAGADEVDLIAYAEQIRDRMGGIGGTDGTIRNALPDGFNKDEMTSATANAIKGYAYGGTDPDDAARMRGYVFSTRADPSTKDIDEIGTYFRNNDNSGAAGVWTGGSDDHVTIDVSGAALNANPNIAGDDFPAKPQDGQKTLGLDRSDSWSGSLYGAAGTYVCASGSCVAERATAGIVLRSGTWRFEPTEGDRAKIAIVDADYQRFGWWVVENSDGEPRTAELYHQAHGFSVARADAVPTTKATYEGGAAGLYAEHETSDAGVESGRSFDFTANARLVANFSTDITNSRVSGTINEFKVKGMDDPDWEISLLSQGFGVQGSSIDKDRDGLDGDFATKLDNSNIRWRSGGNEISNHGGYAVNAYGGAAGTTPTELGGWFRTNSDDGRLVGSFAAE